MPLLLTPTREAEPQSPRPQTATQPRPASFGTPGWLQLEQAAGFNRKPRLESSESALLTDDRIRRSAHRSTAELEAAINAYIDAHNADPKPFRWTKSADDILTAVQRFCQRTITVQTQCA